MIKGFKTEIRPNNKQITMLRQHCGTARFAYNWGLSQRLKQYEETKKSDNAIQQHKTLNKLKKTEFSWMYAVSKCAPQEALRDLDVAYKKFFREKKGFPNFKKKREGRGSFRLTGSIEIFTDKVKIPKIGFIRLKEKNYLPKIKPSQITISEICGKWFVSFNTTVENKVEALSNDIIGIDLGINKLAVLSTGIIFKNPKSLNKGLKRLKHAQKSLSKKAKGSNNRKKAIRNVAKQHFKISNIRKDAIHKMTTLITKNKVSKVVIEDLSVSNMIKNHKLAKSISDCSFYEIRRQLEYKLKEIGTELIIADRFFPSSKLCSNCNNKKDELNLSERTYICEKCGIEIDRDYNSSLNLRGYTASSAGIKVCGESVNLVNVSEQVVSTKQKKDKKLY
jgi:putative transposase